MPTRSRAPAEAIEDFGKQKARSGFSARAHCCDDALLVLICPTAQVAFQKTWRRRAGGKDDARTAQGHGRRKDSD
jgi:hypothetical protein